MEDQTPSAFSWRPSPGPTTKESSSHSPSSESCRHPLNFIAEVTDGVAPWSHWRVNNWGTKWEPNSDSFDIEHDGSDGIFRLSFWTAWSPPTPFASELARRFPGLDFDLLYSETDGGWFAGYATWTNGKLTDDDEVNDPEHAIALLRDREWDGELAEWAEQEA